MPLGGMLQGRAAVSVLLNVSHKEHGPARYLRRLEYPPGQHTGILKTIRNYITGYRIHRSGDG